MLHILTKIQEIYVNKIVKKNSLILQKIQKRFKYCKYWQKIFDLFSIKNKDENVHKIRQRE